MDQGSIQVNGYDAPTDAGVAMLAKALSASNQEGADLIRAMEQSVNPAVGGNIDLYA
ncbi:MAG: YjfB family protein [Lachnospiraceae bacterium]|nr:YjfB family protein [Lachnospiraceae bacterium]